jgi:hypothetical protein
MMTPLPLVKCGDCGLVAFRVFDGATSTLVEIEQLARDNEQYAPSACVLLCFVRAHDLRKEFGERTEGSPHSSGYRLLPILQKERECPAFQKWKQGYSPKEHIEMMQTDLLKKEIEERKKADEERAERRLLNDRKWRKAEKWEDRIYQLVIAVIAFLVGLFVHKVLN